MPCYRVVIHAEGRTVKPITAATSSEAAVRALVITGAIGYRNAVVASVHMRCEADHLYADRIYAAPQSLEQIEHDFWERMR